MELKKAKTAVIATTVAAAIALSGTFAWQSISQMALNEATQIANPGGRLHDDFSGYEETDTKDIYVENFGNEPIYARVRLDEYMEIGEGAGLKGTVGAGGAITPNPDNHATSLVTGATIDDVTTWTTHIPGATSATTGAGTEAPTWADSTKTFHTYWTWTMGGQDTTGNPDGKTVYMPTFNKNKDSLKADINGTLAGLDKDPATGVPYNDYVKYTDTDTASRVRDNDTTTYPDGAAYDADEDTTDECGPYGGAGGTGVAGTNYEMKNETHTAQETESGKVITMAEYNALPDTDPGDGSEWKGSVKAWVYDVDGWAYWSQPIEPGTPTETNEFMTNATGLLLDRIVLTKNPLEKWYYSINAVGQFITADDLGRSDTPQTGFYTDDGEKPSDDALDLLEGIGVNTAAVKGSIAVSASVTVGTDVKPLTYAVQNMNIDLSAVVTVPSATPTDQTVTWKLAGNTDSTTTIDTTGPTPILKVGPTELGTLKIVAESSTYNRLKGTLTLPAQAKAYSVTVTADGGAAGVLPGATQDFTAELVSNDFETGLPQTFTWVLDNTTGVTYKSGTTLTANVSDSSKATLTAAWNEPGPITVKATPTDATYSSLSGTATIPVTAVTYAVNIKDSASPANTVTGTTVDVSVNGSATFTLDVTSTPPGARPTNNWTWTSDTPAVATVSGSGTSATVSVPAAANDGQTATITATNTDDSSLTASFTVNAKIYTPAEAPVGGTTRVGGIDFLVLAKGNVTGKANGETTPTSHSAALLLSKKSYTNTSFGSTNSWDASSIRSRLNTSYVPSNSTINSKAIEVEICTPDGLTRNKQITNDKAFLLSEADMFGTTANGSSPQTWEYTYNNAILPYFANGGSFSTGSRNWLRTPTMSANVTVLNDITGGKTVGACTGSQNVHPAFWYNLDP